ncbi:hypothetical protein G4V62_13990 [Bacillaceae bacterium SIJ1]|uniref:dUTP diphosphatase n=1 Tax=Litoribacterium kuwaitense TaxID=1398745 RepID=UPI0013EC44E8|nr:dUTP diphosphatase [Litoribacterium kuwaitense]NGP46005.1 hypothetical protein [Litoribacterium kuwaitense]
MNLRKLFNMQKQLDDHIVEEKGLQGRYLLDKKVLALQVELGELANEWRGFKFWSEDQEPRYETVEIYIHGYDGPGTNTRASIQEYQAQPILEEYVDCLHFILSIGLELGADEHLEDNKSWSYMAEKNVNQLFRNLFTVNWDTLDDEQWFEYYEGFNYFMSLGKELGFTLDQIEQAYFDKNKVNHERQAGGY